MRTIRYALMICMLLCFTFGAYYSIEYANAEEDHVVKVSMEPSDYLFQLDDLKPGDTIERVLTIQNSGLRGIEYKMSAIAEEESQALLETLLVEIRDGESVLYDGPLSELSQLPERRLSFLQSEALTFRVLFDPEAGNEYQGLTASFKLHVYAEESESEAPVQPELTVENGVTIATIDTKAVKKVPQGGTLNIDLTKVITAEVRMKLTEEQMKLLLEKDTFISLFNENVRLTFPASNFKAAELILVITDLGKESDTLSSVYDFSVYQDGKRIHTFDKSVTAVFQVGDAVSPSIYYFNEETNKWEPVEGSAYKDGEVTAPLLHFSRYTVKESKSTPPAEDPGDGQDDDQDGGLEPVDQETPLPHTNAGYANGLVWGAVMLLAGVAVLFGRAKRAKR